ncbi:chorion class high-cysteine HCB protein 13-like, partial [Stegodyphus dumicola]|uniref:chorion class high-cysteine HCB protein 13-like n=1 Tax=Stegodyphus dumicola TaxID=202533 RepID=UPI0015B132CF
MIFATEKPSIIAKRCLMFSTGTSREQLLERTMYFKSWILILLLFKQFDLGTSQWPQRVIGAKELTACEGLGFPNATLNSCGFCTGGGTGLPGNFSEDCMGSCTDDAVPDCAGLCGGNAYVDECSGQCIAGTTGFSEEDVSSFRDCRGYCTSSGGQFYTDNCGVCHTGTSPFQDCTNRCHLPGQESLMAKLLCGRCVGGTTGVLESEVLDPCGNCRSETLECPCNGTGKPDACGICRGEGKSCMRVTNFRPRAIPVNTYAT